MRGSRAERGEQGVRDSALEPPRGTETDEIGAVVSSDKTATERLRRLLDARGVEWSAQDRFTRDVETRWLFPASSALFTEYEDGMTIMVISGAEWTPEQAIAATLGNDGVERTNDGIAERGTCHDVWDTELTGRLRFQCSECGGVSLEITPHFCPCCGRKVVFE